jgi:flagellar biosynthesis protein FlhF
MRLKSFYAKTLTEAMQMIRDTLGEDAIIVATREENGGKAVRVTAAVDQPFGSSASPAFEIGRNTDQTRQRSYTSSDSPSSSGSDNWLQYDDEHDTGENTVSEDLTDILLAHSAPEDVTDQILSCALVVGYRDSKTALQDTLDHLFQYRPLLTGKAAPKPIILVGPPGVGKTLMVAKLAARCVMNGARVGVITTDTMRAGGVEQLAAFTKILKIDLRRVTSPAELTMTIRDMSGMDYVFIDTAGTLPYDQDDMKDLARLLTAADMDPVLALPAGMDASEAGEVARIFSAVGARRLIPTRLDVGRRLGGLLAAAHQGGLSFAEVSFSPQVAEGFTAMTPARLTDFLLPRSQRAASAASGQTASLSSTRNSKTSGRLS